MKRTIQIGDCLAMAWCMHAYSLLLQLVINPDKDDDDMHPLICAQHPEQAKERRIDAADCTIRQAKREATISSFEENGTDEWLLTCCSWLGQVNLMEQDEQQDSIGTVTSTVRKLFRDCMSQSSVRSCAALRRSLIGGGGLGRWAIGIRARGP